eukprot:4376240-Pyramimonas_sp.AAC.1
MSRMSLFIIMIILQTRCLWGLWDIVHHRLLRNRRFLGPSGSVGGLAALVGDWGRRGRCGGAAQIREGEHDRSINSPRHVNVERVPHLVELRTPCPEGGAPKNSSRSVPLHPSL